MYFSLLHLYGTNDVKQTGTAGILTAPGPADKVVSMVRRHPKQMEGSVPAMRKTIRRHPERQRRIYTRDEENGKLSF